ncbi:Transmembrane and TPR repeat-containing protein 1 [Orchesella cincta]|uniref:Transmembrane and TPR repeat-containing protein 1 n=1 Tax=Orchesella cincta TaxID=48709 RepID=A0A1D2N328_ORCCI|nr:Transmembrane and TPR repeat-containing protein 1 [Orchesella cincta]
MDLGVCILTVHGMECFLVLIKAIKRAITLRHQKNESAFELPAQNSSVSVSASKGKIHDRRNSDFLHIRKLSLFFVCLILVTYGLRTWSRNGVWGSRLALFTSGIKDNPKNAKMHYNYANLQKDMGNTKEAIKHYSTAIRLWPEYASAHNNLGTLLDDPIVAEHEFLRAIRGNHAHGGAHFNLGVLYMIS